MKKITVILSILFLTFTAGTVSAQFQLGNYEAWMDSITPDAAVKNIQFRNSDEMVITKNGKPNEILVTANHKMKILDKRIIIKAGTKGRVVGIVTVSDTIADPNAEAGSDAKLIFTKKVLLVKFDKANDVAPIPFTAGFHLAKNNAFNVDLKNKVFTDGTDSYQLAGGSSLQLDQKSIDAIRAASGYKF